MAKDDDLDLGEFRASESDSDEAEDQEQVKERSIPFRGLTLVLPPKLPFPFLVELARYQKESASRSDAARTGAVATLADALDRLFGADQWQEVMLLQPAPDTDEIVALVNDVTGLYTGGSSGKSPGSDGRSSKAGKRSKRTSSGSTGSTSAEPDPEKPEG